MLGCHHPGKAFQELLCPLGMSSSHHGADFALERMRNTWMISTASSASVSAAPPAVLSEVVAHHNLAWSLPSMSPAAPSLPSESCPPQRAHAMCEKLTHNTPEDYLASRKMEEENKSHKCSPALLVWDTIQRYQHNQDTCPAPCSANVTAVPTLQIPLPG